MILVWCTMHRSMIVIDLIINVFSEWYKIKLDLHLDINKLQMQPYQTQDALPTYASSSNSLQAPCSFMSMTTCYPPSMTSESGSRSTVMKKRYSIETFKGIQPLYDVLRLAQGIFLAHAFASDCFFQHCQNKDMAKLRSIVDDSLSLASLR